jgi:hypothetical protein
LTGVAPPRIAELEYSRQLALDLDPQLVLVGNQVDHLDQGSDKVEGLVSLPKTLSEAG